MNSNSNSNSDSNSNSNSNSNSDSNSNSNSNSNGNSDSNSSISDSKTSAGGLEIYNPLTERIIGAAIAVHRELGPGLLESSYQACMAAELAHIGLDVRREVPLALTYRNVTIEAAYRMDMVVERRVVVEVKAVARLDPIFAAQVLTYLKLSGHRIGLLMNFNRRLVTEGIRRFAL